MDTSIKFFMNVNKDLHQIKIMNSFYSFPAKSFQYACSEFIKLPSCTDNLSSHIQVALARHTKSQVCVCLTLMVSFIFNT